MGPDRPTLRALLWCSATALQHLTRTMAIACVPCLVAKHHSIAELTNTTLSEYQYAGLALGLLHSHRILVPQNQDDPMRTPLTTRLLLLALTLVTSGCGQKGPLYLPPDPEQPPEQSPEQAPEQLPKTDNSESPES